MLDIVVKSSADLHQDYSQQVEYFADRVLFSLPLCCRGIGLPSQSKDMLQRCVSVSYVLRRSEFIQVHFAAPYLNGLERLGPRLEVHTQGSL
jgi:hypothetical protein